VIGAVPPVEVKTRSAQRHVAKAPKENNWMKVFSLHAGRRLNEAACGPAHLCRRLMSKNRRRIPKEYEND
jgi:hypothetical protein